MWPIAFRLLVHDRLKFAVAAAGVSVSVLLILTQLGVYLGFLSTASMLFDHSSADLWLVTEGTREFDNSQTLDERAFYRALGRQGVAHAERVAYMFSEVRLKSGARQSVQLVGIDTGASLLRPWSVIEGSDDLRSTPGAAVVDRSELGKLELDGIGDESEIGGLRIRIVGLTEGIRTFTTSPLIFTDLRRARQHLGWSPSHYTFVVLKVAPGNAVDDVYRRLRTVPGISVYKPESIVASSQAYWAELTGVGISFFSMAVMAIVVGFVIVGQILYNGTMQNLREYATLKAMGARNRTIVGLVFAQAALTAVTGLVLGGVLSYAARGAMQAVNLVVIFSPALLFGTVVLTFGMCLLAALVPTFKLLRLDPASVLT
jgi:putative ABC transport system permease protein